MDTLQKAHDENEWANFYELMIMEKKMLCQLEYADSQVNGGYIWWWKLQNLPYNHPYQPRSQVDTTSLVVGITDY